MTEDQLLHCCRRMADLCGWLHYHTHDSRRSEPGFPDLVLVRGDRVLWRELKVDGNGVTDDQREWLEKLTTAGQDAKVWRETDWLDDSIWRELE